MALTPEAYRRQLQQLLPLGAAWNLDANATLSALLLGVAGELARIDVRGDDLINESDPSTTFELLSDWERILGLPDPCVSDVLTTAQRRLAALARYTAVGGQSRAYYIAVAASLGYAITITEFSEYTVESDVETPIYNAAWAYAWQVNGPTNTVLELTVEDGVEDPIASWTNQPLQCVLNRLKPAHTTVLFVFS